MRVSVAVAAALVLVVSTCMHAYTHAEQETTSAVRETLSLSEEFKQQVARTHRAKRSPRRFEHEVDGDLDNQAGVMFRAMDKDANNKLSLADASNSPLEMQQFFPGVSTAEFGSFIELADKDKDGELSKDEFLDLMGPMVAKQHLDSPVMLETGESRFIGGIGRNILRHTRRFLRKHSGGAVDKFNDECVMCQYIIERLERTVKVSGALASMSSFLQVEQKQFPAPNMMHALTGGVDVAGAGAIANERAATRMQRQVERQKFNEIYRLSDITLDDVCEQGMPHCFYQYCKYIYQEQPDVVDGLRYQFRPADICFKIGMCSKKSYITKGVHSRYRVMLKTGKKKKSFLKRL